MSEISISSFDAEIADVVVALQKANHVFVITGAGMSADSGVPTYRGVGGLYENKNTDDDMPIEKALSGPVFQRSPEITWKYLSQIEKGTRDATFNRGHEVLVEMESKFDRFWILTQNVDGFHTAAGSQNVIEIHGNLHYLQCTDCGKKKTVDDFSEMTIPPVCESCSGMMRPLVVLFEEHLPLDALETLARETRNSFDVVISIGTSSYFPYIVQPVVNAKQKGAFTVEINPTETMLSEIVDVKLPLGAASVLDEIGRRLWRKSSSK